YALLKDAASVIRSKKPRMRGPDEDLTADVRRRGKRPHFFVPGISWGDVLPRTAAITGTRQRGSSTCAAGLHIVNRTRIKSFRLTAILSHTPNRGGIGQGH